LVGIMLGMILPAGVESEECFGSSLCPEPVEGHQHSGETLFPEEERIIAHAVPARRRDYTTVRSCARACLGRLGYPPVPILPGVGGAPMWPAGIRGSMTHCAGYAAAAVGTAPWISTIGIDAEPDAPLPDGVLGLIATSVEQNRLAVMGPEPRRASTSSARMVTQQDSDDPSWDRLLFSAKESVYKAWFPLVGEWLDPQETEILFSPHERTFTALLCRGGLIINGRPVRQIHGRWTREQGILATAVVVTSM
jgi:enterobactin synthetase component D / holo-[acyl-carrier protein] synthase